VEQWSFLTNHGHVLLCIAAEPTIRLRDMAQRVGITERAAQRIVGDLVAAGYVSRMRVGRRNEYRVHGELPFRHHIEGPTGVGPLLAVLQTSREEAARDAPPGDRA
jgi:winged helix-turn-helix DNA-binding protein